MTAFALTSPSSIARQTLPVATLNAWSCSYVYAWRFS